ncbi:MAG: type II CAAX endopeptidase family protein [Halovenus sp.]
MSAGRSLSERVSLPWARGRLRRPPVALVVPTLAVVGSELALFYGQIELALAGHLLTLLGCVLVPLRFRNLLSLLHPFALLPLFRLINLGMPTFVELTLYFFPFVYVPMLPAIYLLKRSHGIQFGTNPKAFVLLVVPVLAIAALSGWVEYLIITPEALIPAWSTEQLLLLVAVQVGLVGLVEETIFRGILQRRMGEYVGRWGGVLFASALFGAMHSIYGSGPEVAFAVSLGLVFGAVYEWTNSLSLVTVFHGVLNVFLFGVYPIHGLPTALLPV